MRRAFTILLAFALLCATTVPAIAESAPLPIRDYFTYADPESDAVTSSKNDAYLKQIDALVQTSDVCCESASLRVTVDEMLAADDMTALAWQVTNLCEEPLYVQCNELDATFGDVEYDLCGGIDWQNYVIRPGETLSARFEGVLLEDGEPNSNEFRLNMRLYALPDSMIETASDFAFTPQEAGLSLKEEFTLRVPMEPQATEVRSALPNGEPIERDFGGHSLRVTEASMNATGVRFTYERIYDTEADARADSPTGDQFWDYDFLDSDGAVWISAAYGDIPDDPVPLPDGRWAWQRSERIYYMFAQPDTVLLQARFFNGAEYVPDEDECIPLTFAN